MAVVAVAVLADGWFAHAWSPWSPRAVGCSWSCPRPGAPWRCWLAWKRRLRSGASGARRLNGHDCDDIVTSTGVGRELQPILIVSDNEAKAVGIRHCLGFNDDALASPTCKLRERGRLLRMVVQLLALHGDTDTRPWREDLVSNRHVLQRHEIDLHNIGVGRSEDELTSSHRKPNTRPRGRRIRRPLEGDESANPCR